MYLHETNKRLLRQTIQSSPLFYKSEVNWTWFTNIIQTLDRQYPHVFNPQDLNQINRETIVYVIQDMKTHISAKIHAQQHHAGFLVGVLDNNEGGLSHVGGGPLESIYSRSDAIHREHESQSKLLQRQNKMKDTLQIKPPPPIDFQIKTMNDSPIENSSELIERQKRVSDTATLPCLSQQIHGKPWLLPPNHLPPN